MLKNIQPRPLFYFAGKYLVCGLALVGLTTVRSVVADEPTNKLVHVVTRQEGEMTRFFVQNLEPTEVTATFDLKLTNLKSSAGFCYTATYAANQMSEAFKLVPINPDKQWAYSYANHFTIGSTSAVHDDSAIYFLPYEAGTECKVTQGYNGHFSHTGSNKYATDWKMPEGTPVLAARGGVVVKIKDLLYRQGFTIPGARQHLRDEVKAQKAQTPLPFPKQPTADLARLRAGLQEILEIVTPPR